MQFLSSRIIIAAAALLLHPSLAAAALPVETLPLPSSSSSCTSLAAETVTTSARPFGFCRKMLRQRFVCPHPARTCSPGEPTQAPYPSETVTADCTPTVVVHMTCGCPSCVAPAATATATATALSP
ncbi:hypothetical protein PG985_014322 [Apiospora marii]|uniref:Uncharacterized protein n=1 Tax=Apiospora marii TaxID=335849 RepID=A0ABR1R5B7_9PEZI